VLSPACNLYILDPDDPTGHEICMDDGNCKKTVTPEMVLAKYGVKFENGSKTWTLKDKLAVLRGVVDVARNLSARTGDTAANAFRDVFNTSSVPMVFLRGNTGSQFTDDGSGYWDDDHKWRPQAVR